LCSSPLQSSPQPSSTRFICCRISSSEFAFVFLYSSDLSYCFLYIPWNCKLVSIYMFQYKHVVWNPNEESINTLKNNQNTVPFNCKERSNCTFCLWQQGLPRQTFLAALISSVRLLWQSIPWNDASFLVNSKVRSCQHSALVVQWHLFFILDGYRCTVSKRYVLFSPVNYWLNANIVTMRFISLFLLWDASVQKEMKKAKEVFIIFCLDYENILYIIYINGSNQIF
jgi:hypothetical protein